METIDVHDPGGRAAALPDWLPQPALAYLAHVLDGRSLRALARADGIAPSTVLRRVRTIEARRDDPLLDELLDVLALPPPAGVAAAARPCPDRSPSKETFPMTAIPQPGALIDDATLAREGKRVLRRLCEVDAVLVVGRGLDQAVVLRDDGVSTPTRTATLPRAVAQAFVAKDWVSCTHAGRVTRYRINAAGRAALARMLGDALRHRREAREAGGMSEAPSPFLAQHVEWGERSVEEPGGPRQLRVNLAESPLGGLARKRDRDGQPFLAMELVLAGERLRDDFERAQMGPRVGQSWERFLTGGERGGFDGRGPCEGPSDARARVSRALRALGPGLGDVVLRVCCFLEGLEATEKRMGWSARSGKIVLRIGLQRLAAHYDELAGRG